MEKESLVIKAIEKLGKDIKLVFIALEVTNLSSPPTSLKRGIYTEDDIMKDLIIFLPQKFPRLKEKKINALWKQFKEIISIRGKCDIFKEFPGYWYRVYRKHYSLILKEIRYHIKLLNLQEKLGLFVFLKNRDLFQIDFTREKLNSILAEKFSEISEPFPNDMGEILIRTGCLFESSYINTNERPLGLSYKVANYLKELDQILLSEFRKDSTISDHIKKFETNQSIEMLEKHCLHCGAPNAANTLRCSKCGNKL